MTQSIARLTVGVSVAYENTFEEPGIDHEGIKYVLAAQRDLQACVIS
jgi:hypothetical protein